MKKGRLIKFEALHKEFSARRNQASEKMAWEKKRSFGPTLTENQIFGYSSKIWNQILEELRTKSKYGNIYAQKLLSAIESKGDNDFIDAIDEYKEKFNIAK